MKQYFFLAVLALPGLASASDFGIEGHGSTLGFGGEVNYAVNSWFTARVQFNRYNYTYTGTKEQVDYNFDLHLKSYAAMLDWHPFAGTFRITGGYFSNKNEIDAVAVPQGTYTINGHTYTAAQVLTLYGTIGFKPNVPYLGIGWTTLGPKDTGLGLSFDVGALFQGTPEANLYATGPITTQSQFQQNLKAEQAKLQDDVGSYKTYPVVTLGITYRF